MSRDDYIDQQSSGAMAKRGGVWRQGLQVDDDDEDWSEDNEFLTHRDKLI